MVKKMALNIDDIQKILPHRYPFLFVDRIDFIEPGSKGFGVKCVSGDEFFFQGHFPQEKVMPGVIIIEALAQVGAIVVLSTEEHKNKLVYFAKIKKAKFRRKVRPGDVLYLEIELVKFKGSIGIGTAIAKVDNEIACEAEITFAIGD